MSTQTDHLQEVFGLIDLLYKHIGNGQHAPAVFLAGGAPLAVNKLPGQLAPAVTPVAVTAASAVSIAAANANRTELRVHNQGPGQVAIGAAGLTWAGRVVVISAGDFWVEDSAPAGAWVAIAAPGATATVTTQEVTK